MVRRILLMLFVFALLPLCVKAAGDTSRTVAEFGHRGFNNLGINDIVAGNDRLDSIQMNRCVRDAVRSIGSRISMPKSKQLITVAGTFSYEIDAHFTGMDALLQVNGNTVVAVRVEEFTKFLESYSTTGGMGDTLSYEFCSIHGDSLYLTPVPRRVDTFAVYYYATGGNVTDDTCTVTLPTEVYDAVEYMATAKAAGILRDWTTSKYWIDLYMSEQEFLLQLYRGRKEK